MRKVLVFSVLLLLGLVLSQCMIFLPETGYAWAQMSCKGLTLVCLAFIMVHVGLEFTMDKSKLKSYGWDYVVAFTAATFPWIFCSLYFFFFYPFSAGASFSEKWGDVLLLGRFASPTSAGVLFAMFAAAGLAGTWMYRKTRVLAIFDDMDTIVLLIPIKMFIMGVEWELLIVFFVLGGLLLFAWKKMRRISLPLNWPYVMLYSVLLTFFCEGLYLATKAIESVAPIEIEILLPAFVLGMVLAWPKEGIEPLLESKKEKKAHLWVSGLFMLLVGLSMPAIEWRELTKEISLGRLIGDIAAITALSNVGKMFPAFCYRKEASWKERFAVALAMCARGEVGAGVILVSLNLITFLSKSAILVAMLSLVLNLLLTGMFIWIIQKLLSCPRPLKR